MEKIKKKPGPRPMAEETKELWIRVPLETWEALNNRAVDHYKSVADYMRELIRKDLAVKCRRKKKVKKK